MFSVRHALVWFSGRRNAGNLAEVIEYPYQRLAAWRVAHAFALEISALSRGFPSGERYVMVPQLVRAARSISANLAEGNGASGPGHFQRHVVIALGSLAEVDNHLICARDEGYVTPEQCEALRAKGWHLRGLMLGLARSLQRARG